MTRSPTNGNPVNDAGTSPGETASSAGVSLLAPDVYTATIVGRATVTESLARLWVRPDEPIPFEVGQYMTLGLVLEGGLVQRPYSVVSLPSEADSAGVEFYVRRIDDGRLTQALLSIPVGQRIRLVGAKGRLPVLDHDQRPLLLVASGTGVAPFVAMVRHLKARGLSRRVVLVHGVSYEGDLGYRSELEELERETAWLSYFPTVSRPQHRANLRWRGRIGRVEAVIAEAWAQLANDDQEVVARVCGVADMARLVEAELIRLGCDPANLVKEYATVPQRPARPTPS